MRKQIQSQVCPLPEPILKKKWAGDFEGALRAIEARLASDLPAMLRDRLTVERELLSRMTRQYPFSREMAIEEIRSHIPDFTEEEFDALEDAGAVDFLYERGKKRYFESVYPMLLEWDRRYIARAGGQPTPARPALDAAIDRIREQGAMGCRIRMRAELRIKEEAFAPGETYRVHLPIPRLCAQQSDIQIAAEPDAHIADERSPQRTIFYERTLARNRPFIVEYEYTHWARDYARSAYPVYPAEPEPTQEDLAEIAPHLTFTPYLRALAREIRGGETDPKRIARACYDFVTRNVTYSYVRDYVLIDHLAEYVATGLKGDCGAQVILLTALLRLNGVPCRWQSGTNAGPESLGSHDWMLIYLAPHGWVSCDPSRGGGAYQAGAMKRWDFYFGNMDPYRMVANGQYMADFDPPGKFLRNDPYDNQSGECETLSRALLREEYLSTRTLIKLETL